MLSGANDFFKKRTLFWKVNLLDKLRVLYEVLYSELKGKCFSDTLDLELNGDAFKTVIHNL